MAFALLKLEYLSGGGAGISVYGYTTADDAVADVAGSGYFALAASMLRVGDHIHVKASDGGTILEVTALTPAVTTTAAISGTVVEQAAEADLTDNSTGAAGATIAAGAGVFTLPIPIDLASIADGDVLTTYTLGYKFKVLAVDFVVTKPVTTAAKATTLNLEIGTTDLTGGAVALTSANCATLGAKVAGTAVTAANTGANNATLSVEASSTTAFAEGAGVLLVKVQNMDTADAVASIIAKANAMLAKLRSAGVLAAA